MSNNDRVVRSITVKTRDKPRGTQGNQDQQNQKTSDVNLAPPTMDALDKIFASRQEPLNVSESTQAKKLNNSISGVSDLIKGNTTSLDLAVVSNKGLSSNLKSLADSLKYKVSKGVENNDGKDEDLNQLIGMESTLGSISNTIAEIEKSSAKTANQAAELNKSLLEFIGQNPNSTSSSVVGEDVSDQIEEQTQVIQDQGSKQKEFDETIDTDNKSNGKTSKALKKSVDFISGTLNKIVQAVFRFSVAASLAAVKWGAILFAIVFGFDVLSTHLKHWFNMFNVSLKDLDENTGVMGPVLESLFNAFVEIKDYFLAGEYLEALKSVFTGVFDIFLSVMGAISTTIAKMVAGILRFFGASETADAVEARAIMDYSKYRNYRISDEDAEVVGRNEATQMRDIFKTAKKEKMSDEEMTLLYQDKAGMDTSEVNEELMKNLVGFRDIQTKSGDKALNAEMATMAKNKNAIELIEKRAEQYSKDESRIEEFYKETLNLKSELENNPGFTENDAVRDQVLGRIEELQANLESRLEDFKDPGPEDGPSNNKDEPSTKNIEKLVEAQSKVEGSKPQTTNQVQQNKNIVNNTSMVQMPVQTSRDVPGMYKSMENNA